MPHKKTTRMPLRTPKSILHPTEPIFQFSSIQEQEKMEYNGNNGVFLRRNPYGITQLTLRGRGSVSHGPSTKRLLIKAAQTFAKGLVEDIIIIKRERIPKTNKRKILASAKTYLLNKKVKYVERELLLTVIENTLQNRKKDLKI
ncbi:MAG: hypothetical protein Q7S21_06020 [archaeon]|nr:hypothetical protein [archaeon]